jgi:hypothetical protein
MGHFFFVLFAAIVGTVWGQTGVCYANCRQGYCNLTSALSCTDCDPGLLNLNSQCFTTNVQPNPLTSLVPNRVNTLLDGKNTTICDINQGTATTRMLFEPVLGTSHTQQFAIPATYSYLHVKYNAILLTDIPYSSTLELLVSVVSSTNLLSPLLTQPMQINASRLSLNCSPVIASRPQQYGVFFVDQKL